MANGALREILLTTVFGEPTGHVISTIVCAAILIVTSLTIKWMAPSSSNVALLIGIVWLAMTVAFEFLVGHFAFGAPWARLLADFDLSRSRIWLLVLMTVALAPFIVVRARYLR